MSSDDLIELYLAGLAERGRSRTTIEYYRENLLRADRELPFGLDRADEEELRSRVHRLELAWASRANYYTTLNGFYRWAQTAGRLSANPMANISRPKVPQGLPRVATDEQARWAVQDMPEPCRLWAILASYGGLRCVEISRLWREHVTEEMITIHRGKGDKPRIIPTHPVIWAAVKDLPAGPITDRTAHRVSARFVQVALRAGFRQFSLHRLRGWHATCTYEYEKDLLAVQRNLGHTKPETTARYVRLTADQRRAVMNGLPTWGEDDPPMLAAA